jgi:hypothetical protein
MSHNAHTGPEDAILFDGCDECSDRANDPIDGLMWLDEEHLSRLHRRVTDVEFLGRDHYRTVNEAKIGRALYRLLVLLERYPDVFEKEVKA